MDPEVWPLMSLLVEEADTEPAPEELLVEEMPLLPVLQANNGSCTHNVAAGCGGYKSVSGGLRLDAMLLFPVLQAYRRSCTCNVAAGGHGAVRPCCRQTQR